MNSRVLIVAAMLVTGCATQQQTAQTDFNWSLLNRKWKIGTGQVVERYSASILAASGNVLIIRYGPDLPGIPEELREWEMRFIGPGTYRWRAAVWREGSYNEVIGVKCSSQRGLTAQRTPAASDVGSHLIEFV